MFYKSFSKCVKYTYEEVLKLQFEESLKCFYDPTSKQVIERVLKKFGYVKMKQPRKENGKKYLVKELDEIVTKEQLKNGILVTIANHHTCIKDSYILDAWDCSFYTIGNYYIKIK